MEEFQVKKRFRKYLYSKTVIAVLIVLIVFLGNASWNIYEKEQESAAQAIRAQNELKRLQEREKLLESELSRLNTQEGLEEEIRSKYSVSKSGEHVIVIVDPPQTEKVTPVEQKKHWWQKIKDLFK